MPESFSKRNATPEYERMILITIHARPMCGVPLFHESRPTDYCSLDERHIIAIE